MEDLDDATVEDVQEFFRIYYAPNNAVLVISGAFETETAKDLVEKYFGSIPSQQLPPKIDVEEPAEVAENLSGIRRSACAASGIFDGLESSAAPNARI